MGLDGSWVLFPKLPFFPVGPLNFLSYGAIYRKEFSVDDLPESLTIISDIDPVLQQNAEELIRATAHFKISFV